MSKNQNRTSIILILSLFFFTFCYSSIPANNLNRIYAQIEQEEQEEQGQQEQEDQEFEDQEQEMSSQEGTPDDELPGYNDPAVYKTDRYIIKYKKNNEDIDFKNILKSELKDAKKLKLRHSDFEVITIDKKIKPHELIAKIQDDSIEYIQPDYEMIVMSEDNEFENQWGLFYKDIESENNCCFGVDAPAAWEYATGEGAIVAVLDTGVDTTHEDLANNIWVNNNEIPENGIDDDGNGYIDDVNGWNFYDDDNIIRDPALINDEWHGTHIAGIIAAVKDNSAGIAGIAPAAKILPIKVFKNGTAYTSDIIEGIGYAVQMGAKIVNCSWGTTYYNSALEEAIEETDMVFVCSAGNNHRNIDSNPVYPASFDCENIITVASIGKGGILSPFSNYGEITVDVAAPGENILSAMPGNEYYQCSGTSMAAAFVSGLAALLIQSDGNPDIPVVKNIITGTSDHLSSLSGIIGNASKINCLNAATGLIESDIIDVPGFIENNLNENGSFINSGYVLHAGSWTSKAVLPESRLAVVCTQAGGKIYAIGGELTNAMYMYDPAADTWTAKAGMSVSRSGHAVAAVNGKIYAIGGYNSGFLNLVEEYDPGTNTWTTRANMPTARDGICSAVINNKIYVMGGYNGNFLNTVEEYDPSTNTWTTKASMISARRVAGAASANGKIYVAGGWSLNSMEEYDPISNTWTSKASMSLSRFCAGVDSVDDKVYVIGGIEYSALDLVEVYDPVTNAWATDTSMPAARCKFGIASHNNKIYTVGGESNCIPVNFNEEFTIPLPPDIEKTVQLNCYTDKIYNLVFSGQNIDDFSSRSFEIAYDADDLELLDAYSLTSVADLSAGSIEGSDIIITQILAGIIKFTIDKAIPSGNMYSGSVITCKFKSKIASGQTTVLFTIKHI